MSSVDGVKNAYNLGGYPPIIFISNEDKKKREFTKKIDKIDKSVYQGINILNIKNILSTKKK